MIQNEIINITGALITQRIVNEVQKCGPFSILADESADVSAHEQLSISVRYTTINVSSSMLMESFLGFVTVFDLTGEEIANSIERFCLSVGLDLNNLVRIGLDGASAIKAGERVGAGGTKYPGPGPCGGPGKAGPRCPSRGQYLGTGVNALQISGMSCNNNYTILYYRYTTIQL